MSSAVATDADLAALLARLGTEVRRITSDSRDVREGDAFAAYPGTRHDGRAFIADAISRGAGAILWETRGFNWNHTWKLPHLPLEDLKAKLGTIADFIYGHPSRELWMVGVTGTNGKTSCAHWIASGLDAAGRKSAVLGTLGNGLLGSLSPASNTTPDAALLHETLAALKAAGAEVVAMEVSSHGLDQGRVNGVAFDVALFTNLSRDHLDYHGTMGAYGAAKAKLLAWPGLRVAVINADDPFGQSLIESARAKGRKVLTYGFGAADVSGTRLTPTSSGLAFHVETPWGKGEVKTGLVGAFNASNLLGVLGVLLVSGVEFEQALGFVARVDAPPGRMQRGGGGRAPLVVVDYAHTPDALEKVLTALRSAVVSGGELVCLFGCGGERDRGKRPEMGRVAGELADRVIITSDNPRSEDPETIASEIVHGIRETGNRRYGVQLDRAVAIAGAISHAHVGDVVLLAGKGHETYQEAAGERQPFLDWDHATRALAAWSGR
ncbi:MAG TPA: UDP-N-acetylmuramoyl-L-alanyl-D-glutamate--2,6-diaminopimelate ligase [Casimicrobiaceae bacterium]|jgi:UDP-N-acetylmuramoyl-L-alanyl-D-glutamate--2,6-diaminopimelate ligase|nr:UDP-N-acetylmuramoyl-L-alanyl-D-glutamate--2,6-diaminopimelate ligase [Casimicrobiaceae bacterium]